MLQPTGKRGTAFRGKSRYRPKGVHGKGVGDVRNGSEMRQKSVKNAPKWVLVLLVKEQRSKMRQKCVKNTFLKNPSKMRGTPLAENTFWTIPKIGKENGHIWMASTHGRANISRHSIAKTAC